MKNPYEDNIYLSNVWEHLSYAMHKKTVKIIEMSRKIKIIKNLIISIGIITLGLIIYVFSKIELYVDRIIPGIFDIPAGSQLSNIDILFLIMLVVGAAYIYLKSQELKKIREEFESLRKNLVGKVNHIFCQHGEKCDCEQSYVKGMEQEGIDVIY